ncbi:MAG: RidA family protein [Chloroflexota bacterium]
MAADRRSVSSGSPWEGPYGYARAVAVGDSCWVSGTVDPSGEHPGDPAGQARAAWAIVLRALGEAGFDVDDVVRTRMYVTDAAFSAAVADVHGQVFGEIRPATTLIVVSALIAPDLLVEVEAEARRGG